MEGFVQIQITSEGINGGRQLGSERHHQFQFLLKGVKPGELAPVLQPFGCEPGCRTFQNTAHLDGVIHIGQRECAHDEAASRNDFEQTFVRQTIESQPNRSPRNAQPRDQRKLR